MMRKLMVTAFSTLCLGAVITANASTNKPSNWPNYVAMGTSTNLSTPMPEGNIDAISHYADWGNDGNLPTEAPNVTDSSIASLVSYANKYNSAPVAIVYTMNLSGSADLKAWDNTNDISWGFENLLIVAKQLQESKPVGTMIINPDFLGTIQQNNLQALHSAQIFPAHLWLH